MRTIDRLRSGHVAHPRGFGAATHDIDVMVLELNRKTVKAIVADNVALNIAEHRPGVCLQDYPSLAPPWQRFWIEYRSSSGKQRRGVLIEDLTDEAWIDGESIGPLRSGAVDDAVRNGATADDVVWLVGMVLVVEQDRKVWGPAGILVLALDHAGKVIGNRWSVSPALDPTPATEVVNADPVLGAPPGLDDADVASMEAILNAAKSGKRPTDDAEARRLYELANAHVGELHEYRDALDARLAELDKAGETLQLVKAMVDEDGTMPDSAEWLMRALAAALQTVALLHCRNVALDEVTAPAKVQAQRRKAGKPPLATYHTVRIDLPRQALAAGSGRATPSVMAAHIVAGHFAHYGACCPDHEPRGLLFGRLTGVYWVPMHARGDRSAGVRETDLEVRNVASLDV